MRLLIEHVRKSFGSVVVLDDVTFQLGKAEFVCLLGPSGCGKTTLLRVIAGLAAIDGGRIVLDGRDLAEVAARDRSFGIVFQAYSLFPNMTVAENVGYGLKIQRLPQKTIDERVKGLLELIRLPHVAGRFPYELSGGQQQRVALARAIAFEPALLLLDEPLSALDAQVRQELRGEIRALQRRLHIPTIMVTHDQEEALSLSDRILCMNSGRIEQMGAPADLYLRPATRFVATFMGLSNLLPVAALREHFADKLEAVPPPSAEHVLCVRPEHIEIGAGGMVGTVTGVEFLGNVTRLQVASAFGDLLAELPGQASFNPGDRVGVGIHPAAGAWVGT